MRCAPPPSPNWDGCARPTWPSSRIIGSWSAGCMVISVTHPIWARCLHSLASALRSSIGSVSSRSWGSCCRSISIASTRRKLRLRRHSVQTAKHIVSVRSICSRVSAERDQRGEPSGSTHGKHPSGLARCFGRQCLCRHHAGDRRCRARLLCCWVFMNCRGQRDASHAMRVRVAAHVYRS